MKKSDLLDMVASELKALAKKMKLAVPARATKADVIDMLLAAAKPKKRTAGKKAAAGKAVAKKSIKAKKSASTKKPAAPARARARRGPEKIAPVHEWKMPPGAEEPLMAQERVSESKYYTGPGQQAPVASAGDLPQAYGDDKIVLMPRDPSVVYAYWEATPARIEREKAWFGWNSKLAVRIYDITGVHFDGRNASGYVDQEISEQVGSWYFDLGRPNHSFCADLGLLSPEGRFLTLSRSNYITLPRDGVSDVIDEEWMLVDEEFWKLYGMPSGLSSPQMQEMLKRRRMMEVTSPGMFSRDRAKARRK